MKEGLIKDTYEVVIKDIQTVIFKTFGANAKSI